MWPFTKHLPIEQLDDTNHLWSVARGMDSDTDKPFLLRINNTAKKWKGHPALNIRLGIAIPFNGNMPDSEENIVLNDKEDMIYEIVKKTGPCIHVATITNDEMKEFVFYIQNGPAVAELHKELQTKITTHEVQCIADYDEDWTIYNSLSG